MDASLCLYKGKLKEALTLVPSMSPEKKVEAVAYWNDLADQLQEIVQKSNYGLNTHQNLLARANNHIHSVYTSSIECQNSTSIDSAHCDPELINGLSNSNGDSHVLNTPAIKQAHMNQFHQENLLDKTIFESAYLDDSPIQSTLDLCKDHLPSLANEKINAELIDPLPGIASDYALNQHNISCSSRTPVNTTSCSTAQNNSNLHHLGDQFNVMKHSDMLTQVPNLQISSHILNYLPNDGSGLTPNNNVNKLDQSNMNPSAEFDNVMLSNSLSCPRTTTTMIDEIGNGQFDRGPKLFEEIEAFAQFEPIPQAINLNSTLGINTFVSARNELFTQSDRPLQPIQLFNSSPNYYIGQQPSALSNNKKCLFCNTCNQQLESLDDLERHEQLHSPVKEGLSLEETEKVEHNSNNYTEVKQESAGNNVERDKILTSNSPHTCEVCGKSGFSTKGNLKRHLRAHSGEKPFKCEYCESCFTEKKSLKIHVRRHTGEKPYKCEICGKLFSQTGVLQSHMALHLNERKFDCQKCGKAFRQRSQLNLHLMRHDGVKRLECSTCMAKFLTKGDLERHCRIHTGERPYACKICNKTFTRQQSLNEHMNRHTGRKPYDCKYCEKTFSEMSACYKHAKTHKKQDQALQHQQQLQLQLQNQQ